MAELIDILQFNTTIPDMRDFQENTGISIVNSGRALLVEVPTFNKFVTDDYDLIHAKVRKGKDGKPIEVPCPIEKEQVDVAVTLHKRNNWMIRTVLLKLPGAFRVTADLSSNCSMQDGPIPRANQKIRPIFLSTNAASFPDQTVAPWASFLRIFDPDAETKKLKLDDEEEEDDSLDAMLAGMAI